MWALVLICSGACRGYAIEGFNLVRLYDSKSICTDRELEGGMWTEDPGETDKSVPGSKWIMQSVPSNQRRVYTYKCVFLIAGEMD